MGDHEICLVRVIALISTVVFFQFVKDSPSNLLGKLDRQVYKRMFSAILSPVWTLASTRVVS